MNQKKQENKKKIGPRGGGSIDDMEIEYIEKTNKRLQAPTAGFMGNSYDPTQKEEVQEAVFDVRLNVDGAVDTSSVNSVVKMLKDKGIMAKVQPSERDGQAVTINSSASKNRVINVLGNIVDEEVQETHCFVTNKQNQKQKEVGGEKEPIKTTKNEWKTFAMMAAELREKKEQKKEDKKEMQAGDDTRDKKQKTMTGEIATSPEMNPKVDYKY